MVLRNELQILLVEDDEGHATLIQLNLREAGLNCPIEHIVDGAKALEYIHRFQAKEQSVALAVLLDINLPGVNGYEILGQLKSHRVTRKIPVIVLSSTDDPHEIDRCYELGCNLFLRKPVDYASFIQTIQQLGLFLSIIEVPKAKKAAGYENPLR